MSTSLRTLVSDRWLKGWLFLALMMLFWGGKPAVVQAKAPADQFPPPVLVSPADWVNIASLTPKLSWTKIAGAGGYVLHISSSQDFSDEIVHTLTTTSYTVLASDELSFGATYYWKVFACPAPPGPCVSSDVRRFTLTFQKTPSDGAYSTASNLTFTWAAVPKALSYRLYLSDPLDNVTLYYPGLQTNYTVPNPPVGHSKWWVCVDLDIIGNECTSAWMVTVTTLPAAPELVSPQSKYFLNSSLPIFEWYTVDGDIFYYQIQADNVATFAHPDIDRLDVGGTPGAYTPLSALADGVYYWRVRAVNTDNAAGKWSPAWQLTIDTQSPPAPLKLSPLEYAVTTATRPTFIWTKSPGAVIYDLGIQNASGSAYLLSKKGLKATSYTLSVSEALIPNQSYLWTVVARDAANNYVTPQSFLLTVANPIPQPLPVPALNLPLDKALLNVSPTLTWDTGSASYQSVVEASSNPTFETYQIYDTIPASINQDAMLFGDGTYYWRVRTIDSGGSSGLWSKARSFTINSTVPAAPVLLSPALDAITGQHHPTFKWSAVPGAVSYKLMISVNNSWLPTVATSKTSYTPSKSLDYGLVQWVVDAVDAFGIESSPSITGSFSIPLQISPANGAHISNNRITYKWASYPGATTYHVVLTSTSTSSLDTYITGTSFAYPFDAPAGIYTWFVEPLDVSPVPVHALFSFYITPGLPAAPKLLQPAARSLIATSKPSFLWTTHNSTDRYDFEIGTSPKFTGWTEAVADIQNPVGSLPGIDYQIVGLPPQGQNWIYYWRVRCVNGGVPGLWSAVSSFTMDIYAPDHPTLLSPADQGAVTNPPFKLSWTSVAEAVGYDVAIAYGDLPDPSDPAFPPPTHLGKVTSYKLPITLKEGGYTWSVRSYDAAGNQSAWAAPQTFTILAGQSVPKTPAPTPTIEPSPTPESSEPTIEPTPITEPTEPTVAPSDTPSPADAPAEAPTAAPPEPSATPEP